MKTSKVLDCGQESVFSKLNVYASKSQTVEPKSEPLIRYPRRIKGYLKLKLLTNNSFRRGLIFSLYYSVQGVTWTEIGYAFP